LLKPVFEIIIFSVLKEKFLKLKNLRDFISSPKIFEIKYKDESKEIVEKLINDYSNLN